MNIYTKEFQDSHVSVVVTNHRGTHTYYAASIDELDVGEPLKKKPTAKKIYTKDEWRVDGDWKRWACGDTDDVSRETFLKKNATVYVGDVFEDANE